MVRFAGRLLFGAELRFLHQNMRLHKVLSCVVLLIEVCRDRRLKEEKRNYGIRIKASLLTQEGSFAIFGLSLHRSHFRPMIASRYGHDVSGIEFHRHRTLEQID